MIDPNHDFLGFAYQIKLFRFSTVKGTVPRQSLNLKKIMATFCKSEKPVLHRETPCLKNRRF
jgi:hypothetical protein